MSDTQTALRKVGKNGPKVPAIGFGSMGLSIAYGAIGSDEERLKLLDRAWEVGCTNWDTADGYGDSEDLIGKWFKLHPERRDDIFLATKFGLRKNSDTLLDYRVDSSPEYCKEAIEKSLKRLGVSHVDLYYIHRANPETPIEKTVKAMRDLVQQGKVKYIGLSEVSSDTLRRAYAVHPVSAVQMNYSPWDLYIEGPAGTNLLATCKELGVAVFAYSPLGQGLLTGRFRSVEDFEPEDGRRNFERFQPGNFDKNLAVVDEFSDMAKRKGCSASQLVLAWLLRQSELIFVIPGTKQVKYLEDNVGAVKVALTDEEDVELRNIVERANVAGEAPVVLGHFVTTVPLH